jgi:hypothetical protein
MATTSSSDNSRFDLLSFTSTQAALDEKHNCLSEHLGRCTQLEGSRVLEEKEEAVATGKGTRDPVRHGNRRQSGRP